MTTLREAAQQALEALNVYASKAEHRRTHADDCAAEEAITALRAALAEPVHEPLGWAVQIGIHSAGRRQGKPRYVIFFDKADAEALAYRTGTHSQPIPFYLGHGIT